MPNSYVYNPELNLTGQSMNDWQTGSSNVLLKTLIRQALGFLPNFEGLRLAPAGWMPFRACRFAARAHGRRIRIEYATGNVPQRQFRLHGRPLDTVTRDETLGVLTAYTPYDRLSATAENVFEVVDPLPG